MREVDEIFQGRAKAKHLQGVGGWELNNGSRTARGGIKGPQYSLDNWTAEPIYLSIEMP